MNACQPNHNDYDHGQYNWGICLPILLHQNVCCAHRNNVTSK